MNTKINKRILLIIGLAVFFAAAGTVLLLRYVPLWRTSYKWNVVSSENVSEEVTRTQELTETKNGSLSAVNYSFSDGTVFSTKELEITENTDSQQVLESFTLPGKALNVRYYDRSSGTWYGGDYPRGCTLGFGMAFVSTDKAEAIVCMPQAYKRGELSTIEALSGQMGGFKATWLPTGWRIDILAPATENADIVDYFILKSPEKLMDWSNPYAETTWAGYQFTGDNRWLPEGYYYITPQGYQPSGERIYYPLTAAYISCSFVSMAEAYPAAGYMAVAMLDTLCRRQSSAGYTETTVESPWLMDDYGVTAGFYDTRFNTDFIEAVAAAYDKFGISRFYDTAVAYKDYFLDYAARCHQTTGEGWLVWDYASEGSRETHTSLNHQIAEMILLGKLYDLTGDEACLDLRKKLYLGLAETEDLWYKDNGDLEYALLEGQPVGEDYPYLTYNDLYEYSSLCPEDELPLIQRLMAQKLQFMEDNGITGYAGTESWRS